MNLKSKKGPSFKQFFSSIKELQEWSLNPANALFVLDSENLIEDFNKEAEKQFNLHLSEPIAIDKIIDNQDIQKKIWQTSSFFNKAIKISDHDFLFSSISFFINKKKYFLLIFYRQSLFDADKQHILDAVLNNDLFGIYIYNGEQMLFCNHMIETMSGYSISELYNMSIWDLIYYPEDKIKLRDAALRRLKSLVPPQVTEFYIRKKDGSKVLGAFYLTVVHYKGQKTILGVVIDVTERNKMETFLKRARKLEMMGELSAHFYHDFNNYLAGIMGHLSLISSSAKDIPEILTYSQTAEQICEKAGKLTENLMSLGKNQELEMNLIDIGKVIEESLKILKNPIMAQKIKVTTKIENGPFFIKGDFIKLEEVFINLFSNALEAMEEEKTLHIELSRVYLDKHFVSLDKNLFEGNYVYITITDEGSGIKKEHQDKIFEPFFSTKTAEKQNMGLGLAIVYGIISAHHGQISVYSEENVGTTFKIYLPIEDNIIDQHVEKEDLVNFRGKGHILVVDDDLVLQKVLVSLLEQLGYTTSSASNGAEALDVIEKNKASNSKIDVVILDLIMPVMDGQQTFYALKKQFPDIKVLISSGYHLNSAGQTLLDDGASGFLHKPYRINDLGKKIKEIL